MHLGPAIQLGSIYKERVYVQEVVTLHLELLSRSHNHPSYQLTKGAHVKYIPQWGMHSFLTDNPRLTSPRTTTFLFNVDKFS